MVGIYLRDWHGNMFLIREHLTKSATDSDITRLWNQVKSNCKQSDIASYIRCHIPNRLHEFYGNPRSWGLYVNKNTPIYWFK